MNNKTVWVCGRYFVCDAKNSCGLPGSFDVLGIYSSKEKALARAKQHNDFIAPITLDEDQPEEISEWVGAEYPFAQHEAISYERRSIPKQPSPIVTYHESGLSDLTIWIKRLFDK